eukprot:2374232-Rhodomonas_salina.2
MRVRSEEGGARIPGGRRAEGGRTEDRREREAGPSESEERGASGKGHGYTPCAEIVGAGLRCRSFGAAWRGKGHVACERTRGVREDTW